MHYFSPENSSVGERLAPRGGTTRPDERKITIIYILGLYHKQYGLCGGLISFLCFTFSSYPFQYPSFWTVLCFLLAGMATIQSKPQIYSDNLSLPILFVSSVCVFLSLSSPYKQIEIWGKCRILYPKGETALAINGYKLLFHH